MKNSITFIALLVVMTVSAFADSAPSRGTNPLLRFVAEVRILRELALYTLLENRCARYMKNTEKESCYEAVDQKVTLLDFDILLGKDKKTPVLMDKNNPGSFVFVAFKKDFLRLLSEQKTEDFLDLVNSEMTSNPSANLWNLALKFYGNEFEAARALAVLFQDTSHVKLHLAYLEMSGAQGTTSYFDRNRELLGRTIDTINMVLDMNGDNFQSLFYPEAVQGKLHRTLYHFYVPTYLSLALKKKGVPERFAFIAPLMMTLTYEFVTAAPDFRNLFNDPATVGDWSLGDIYGGYNGVSFGTSRMHKVIPFADVRKAFDVSTANGVATLLK